MSIRSLNRWVILLLIWIVLAQKVYGADYGVFIEIETEDDLLDLLKSEEIDEDTYETLVELLANKVDLNNADRDALFVLPNITYEQVDQIIRYREEFGQITDPAVLVVAKIIDERTLSSIMPFITFRDLKKKGLAATHGSFRYRTSVLFGEERVPAMTMTGQVSTLNYLDLGVVGVVTRNKISDVRYDPNRNALSAKPAKVRFEVPKYFIQWEDNRWHAIVGTYRIGFGERLTFDNTGKEKPNGIEEDDTIYYSQDLVSACKESQGELAESPCSGSEMWAYTSPDYRWTDRLRGGAVGIKRLNMGGGWVQAYGFASYQTKGIYQYELYDKGKCSDPQDDKSEACKSPKVYVRGENPLEQSSTFKYQTLPEMFNEFTAGGNFSYFLNSRTHLGVTGYGGDIHFLTRGIYLDFQEWSRTPYGGAFGAVGINGAFGYKRLDISGELARSFDHQPEGGGWAGVVRGVTSIGGHEVETSLRYYDYRFANPYARPLSEPDEYDGLRARDEGGIRLKYSGSFGGLTIKGMVDAWTPVSTFIPKLAMRVRTDYSVAKWFIPGLWIEYQDRDLSKSGRGACFEVNDEIEGEPIPCTGEKVVFGTQLRFLPLRSLSLFLKYQHKFIDDSGGGGRFSDSFRQDLKVWAGFIYCPIQNLRLRGQVRYMNEDITSNTYLEDSLWWYIEGTYGFRKIMGLTIRYEFFSFLDKRESTINRSPNPVHMIRFETKVSL